MAEKEEGMLRLLFETGNLLMRRNRVVQTEAARVTPGPDHLAVVEEDVETLLERHEAVDALVEPCVVLSESSLVLIEKR